MFISSASVQGSLWGWTNKALPATGISSSSINFGTYSGFTLAPNGFSYAIPTRIGTTENAVLVINPGTGNNGLVNYSNGTYNSVAATGATGKPNFVQAGFISKGILAQNGKIYFIPSINVTGGATSYDICILTPNAGTNCTWEFFTVNDLGVNGGILGKDGKIYLIPQGLTTKLQRLDISGATPTIETSFYDGTPLGTTTNKTGSSSGNIITLTSNTAGISVGMRVILYNANNNAVLNPNDDTIVTGIGPGPQVTVNLAPSVPLPAGTSITFAVPSRNLAGTTTQGKRWFNFLNKSFVSGDFPTVAPFYDNPVYELQRHSQQYLATEAANSNTQITYTAVLSGTDDKIFIFPGFGTQIFYIDPTNWGNKDALTTKPGLALSNVGIKSGSPTQTATTQINSFKKFTGVLPNASGTRLYFSVFSSDATSTNFVIPALQNLYYIDTVNFTIGNAGSTSTTTDYSAPGLFPNGDIVSIKTNFNTSAPAAYMSNFVFDSRDSILKMNLKTLDAKSTTYPNDISNRGYSAGAYAQQTGFLCFSGNAVGKVILPAKANMTIYGIEYLSVKGFYTGVTRFNLLESSKIQIPTTLSDLPTSQYNVFRNTQC